MSTLYVIGIGPGDPELLTLKAVRLIRDVPVIFVPKGREDGRSLALSIVSRIIDLSNKRVVELHFPMVKTKDITDDIQNRWETLSDEVINNLQESDAAFLTLGDPCFYSTFFYLSSRIKGAVPGLKIKIVPGISSINAGAAEAGISLGLADEKIAIIPANYFNLEEAVIKTFDTLVFMKVDKRFDDLKKFLSDHALIEKAIYVSRVGMEGERIIRDISTITNDDLDYFSILIIKR